jgi:hypothetical protein
MANVCTPARPSPAARHGGPRRPVAIVVRAHRQRGALAAGRARAAGARADREPRRVSRGGPGPGPLPPSGHGRCTRTDDIEVAAAADRTGMSLAIASGGDWRRWRATSPDSPLPADGRSEGDRPPTGPGDRVEQDEDCRRCLRRPGHSTGVLAWFLPRFPGMSRTERELARTFVFTHHLRPGHLPADVDLPLRRRDEHRLARSSCSPRHLELLGTALPAARDGQHGLGALASFQMLAAISLFGAYHYGGFSSPFLPWLIVSLLLGLCYQSKNAGMVIAVFALDLVVFACVVVGRRHPRPGAARRPGALGWLSITSAAPST